MTKLTGTVKARVTVLRGDALVVVEGLGRFTEECPKGTESHFCRVLKGLLLEHGASQVVLEFNGSLR